MSYAILYRAMFVKLSGDKYIPIIESGDNNVWECDNKRRARSWYHARWIMKSKTEYAFTADEIMKGVEAMIDSVKARYVGNERPDYDRCGEGVYTDKEIEARFGWFDGISVYSKGTTNTTAQQIRNFFKKGIEMAVTLDDIRLDVHWCPKYPNYEHRYVSTEEKLAAAFKEGLDTGADVWIGFSGTADYLYERRKAETAKKRVSVEHTKGWAVLCNGNYILKVTSRRFHMTYYPEYAHIYSSRSVAEKLYRKVIRNNYSSEIVEMQKVNGEWQHAEQLAQCV